MTLANPPTAWQPTKLFDLAAGLLDVCRSILDDGGAGPHDLYYVCGNATPTGACEQLVVTLGRLFHGTPTGTDRPTPIKGQMSPRTALLAVWSFRCLTDMLTGEAVQTERAASPNPDAATADARRIMGDAYLLHKGLVIAHAQGLIGTDFGSPIVIGDAVPMAAAGGIGGCRIDVTYELV